MKQYETERLNRLQHWQCRVLARASPSFCPDLEVAIDARLWTHYHETHWPHHLTVTTAY